MVKHTGNQGFSKYSIGVKGNCHYCHTPLRKIGEDRKNGKSINNKTNKDWKTRKFHKSCYKKVQREEVYQWARTSREKEEIVFSFD